MIHSHDFSRRWRPGLFLGAALACLVGVLLVAPSSGHATVVRALGVEQQVGLSAVVVEGRVGVAQVSRNPSTGRPTTDTPIHIIATLYGEAPVGGVLLVRQTRGILDGKRTVVVGDPQLNTGDRVIVMLRCVDGRYYLTALSQSVFWVRDEVTPARVEQRLDGLVRMTETANGLVPAAGDDRSTPLTAEALRQRIRALEVSR